MVLPSLENAGDPSQADESEAETNLGSLQPSWATNLLMYKSTSGETSFRFPEFPLAKIMVLPSGEKVGVPSFLSGSKIFLLSGSIGPKLPKSSETFVLYIPKKGKPLE